MPSGADPGAAELAVQLPGEAPQPAGDPAGLRPAASLVNSRLTHTWTIDRPSVVGFDLRPGPAEQLRKHDGEPRRHDLLGEADHAGRDPGDLVDDDHAGSGAPAVRRMGDPLEGVAARDPALEE